MPDPTGWIDPLGLANKKGDEFCCGGDVTNTAPGPANLASNKIRLKTQLFLQEEGLLDTQGRLTQRALSSAYETKTTQQGVLQNKTVVQELTKDGSHIEDWGKYTTETVYTKPSNSIVADQNGQLSLIPNGQPQGLQIHFYINRRTGEINYTHQDFKVKNKVAEVFEPRRKREPAVQVQIETDHGYYDFTNVGRRGL
ncbi:hypothetical protein [Motilimonas pumila]|uniref:Uncharacterized protein n=1 Tax=Motilimonas pumila TaxID=2303987 RepID=A0A418Y931_9GAMM|nr:hypothetical protein [Motilimonas pumila]RJG36161.1 hypothetical protein D1Z90_20505 [Motilimonas pumila]